MLHFWLQRLSVSDRTNLLEDAFSLADASELEYSIAMDLTLYLPEERHSIPWSVADTKLTTVDTLLSSTDISSKFKVI